MQAFPNGSFSIQTMEPKGDHASDHGHAPATARQPFMLRSSFHKTTDNEAFLPSYVCDLYWKQCSSVPYDTPSLYTSVLVTHYVRCKGDSSGWKKDLKTFNRGSCIQRENIPLGVFFLCLLLSKCFLKSGKVRWGQGKKICARSTDLQQKYKKLLKQSIYWFWDQKRGFLH